MGIKTNMEKSIMALLQLLLLLPIISFATQFDQESNYLKFITDATNLPSEEHYDYIIIGGGTAGCPLAATLSKSYSVLVLERGGEPQENPNVLTQNGLLANLMEQETGRNPAQLFTSNEGVVNARGRVLGGTSMINAGFYSRGDNEFYEKSGINLDMGIVGKAYEWVEKRLVYWTEVSFWQNVVKDGLIESGLGPDNGLSLDHLDGTKIGGSTFDDVGKRHGAVELLSYGDVENLKVGIHASVEKILFSNSQKGLSATGVIYTDSAGDTHRATINKNGEVILSAGAIGSPQLLLLSGVGPSSDLSSLNIPIIHDQPFVGKFMFDNPRNGINIAIPFPIDPSKAQVVGISRNDFYIETLSFPSPFFLPPPFGLFPTVAKSTNINIGLIGEKLPGPISNGSLKISSTEVKTPPTVGFNYFSDPTDLARCVKGLRKIGDLLKTTSLKRFMYEDLNGNKGYNFVGPNLPNNYENDDVAMENFCKNTHTTVWHFHGGCLVGKVVDENFRVIGIDKLRVVDSSVFNWSPGTNPQATVMMLGRYVGVKILEERMGEDQSDFSKNSYVHLTDEL